MIKLVTVVMSAVLLSACASEPVEPVNKSTSGYVDPDDRQQTMGVGIESQDIIAMSSQISREILANPTIGKRDLPPRVIVDDKYFTNESTSRINKRLLTDRLRVELNQASKGRLVFVGRQHVAMVEKERALKRSGMVDAGHNRTTEATAGADYRLVGRIASLDTVSNSSGQQMRFHQIIFELIDLELGTIAWNGLYEFKKAATDDVVYR